MSHQLLPPSSLGAFFSKRLLIASMMACGGTLLAGLLVDHPPLGKANYAFALAFVGAGLAGLPGLDAGQLELGQLANAEALNLWGRLSDRLVSAVAGGMAPIAGGVMAQWFSVHELAIIVRWIAPRGGGDMSLLDFAHELGLEALRAVNHLSSAGGLLVSLFTFERNEGSAETPSAGL